MLHRRNTRLPLIVGFVSLACAPKVPAEPPEAESPAQPAPPALPPEPATQAPASADSAALERESVGIAECDEYLWLYRQCERTLQSAIQAGDRRSYEAERGWLSYVKDTPEGAELPEACREMTLELQDVCASRD